MLKPAVHSSTAATTAFALTSTNGSRTDDQTAAARPLSSVSVTLSVSEDSDRVQLSLSTSTNAPAVAAEPTQDAASTGRAANAESGVSASTAQSDRDDTSFAHSSYAGSADGSQPGIATIQFDSPASCVVICIPV